MKKTIFLVLRITIAVLLIQTLWYKFTAHPDSVYIFSKIGLEPYGRIFIGLLELISAVLLFIPKTIWAGALLSLSIISGAIFFHLTILGIEIHHDNGLLFYLAISIFLLSITVLLFTKKNIPFIGKKL